MLKYRSKVVTTLVAISLALAASSAVAKEKTASPAIKLETLYQNPDLQDQFLKRVLMDKFRDPLMLKIAGCESTGNPNKILHWRPDGSLVKNPGSSASGWGQALLQYHADDIAQQGLNMKQLDDYNNFIEYLRERGKDPYRSWNESKPCWGKYRKIAKLS